MSGDVTQCAVTHDRLLGGRLEFTQPAEGYRAAIDPVLLAAAVPARDGETVLELGSGAGAAALCLAMRVPGCRVTGIERDRTLVDLANGNAAANGMSDRVRFMCGDVAALPPDAAGAAADHALANPPFLPAGRADLRAIARPGQRTATIEAGVSLVVWIDALCRAVRPKGRITLIQRADRLDDILAALNGRAGDIAILPLQPHAGSPARRVIVTARPATAAPLRLLAGLVLHDSSGDFTPAAREILEDGAPLAL